MKSRTIGALSGMVWLCILLRVAIVLVEGFALLAFGVVEHAVDVYSRTGRMLDVPSWLVSTHLWFEAHLAALVAVLSTAFMIAFTGVLVLALASVGPMRAPMAWTARLVVTLPIPYANLLLPWIGLNAIRQALAHAARSRAGTTIDPATALFATAFVTKLLIDAAAGSADIRTNLFHTSPPSAYRLYSEQLARYDIGLGSSIVFLAVFGCYWLAFARRCAEARRTTGLERAF